MSKHLPDLEWQPAWLSHLGCLKGCLDYLKIPISTAWLYGGTGHAFILNIDPTGCPSGPTAWCTEMISNLGNNLGYTTSGLFATKPQPDFAVKQRAAWEFIKNAIDRGLPCYGWELEMPEFYVFNGYDDEGYYYSGPAAGSSKGPKPWMELGQAETGWLELYCVERGHSADAITVVKEAFQFVLEHATSPAKWIYPNYKAGLGGYDNWIQAIQSPNANPTGLAYNAAVWSECRHHAVAFLDEAMERIGGELAPLLADARVHYHVVAEQLKALSELYPFWPELKPNTPDTQAKAIVILQVARQAEAEGLKALAKAVDVINQA